MTRRVHHEPRFAPRAQEPGVCPRGLSRRVETVIVWAFMPVVIGLCCGAAWLLTLWGVA